MSMWNIMRALAKHIQNHPDEDMEASLIERELQDVVIDAHDMPAYAARIESLIKRFRYEGRGRNPLEEIHSTIKIFQHNKLAFLLNQYTSEDFEWTRQNMPIDIGMSVEDKSPFINTAIIYNNFKAVEWLEDIHMAYEHSKYPDVEYPNMTMFMRIVGRSNGKYVNVKFYKSNSLGADDNSLITPAMACLERKKDNELQWLLTHPNFCPEENTNANKTSLLHWAVRFGNPRHIKWCLEKFDVNILNNKRETPLFMAAKIGHIKKLKLLLNAGANPSVRSKVRHHTPFIAAASSGHLNMVKRLPKKDMYYALCEAITNKHTSVVKWLLNNGAPFTLQKESCSEDFILFMAMQSCAQIKKLLWQSGAGAVVSVKDMAKWSCFEPRTFEWPEKCSICYDNNKFPVRLSCGHISCGKCMHRLIIHSLHRNEMKPVVSCPECRKKSSLVEIMSLKSVKHTQENVSKVEEASKLYTDEIRSYSRETNELKKNIESAQTLLIMLERRHLEMKHQLKTYQKKHDEAVLKARQEMLRVL